MMQPFIYEKTRDGEVMYDVYSRLVKDRIVFLLGEVTTENATSISATLLFLDSQDHTKPISLYINSPGGLVHSGLFTIIDTMNYIKAPVQTLCVGEAYSAAAMILSAGAKGMRMAFENADIMIHDIQSGTIGSISTMDRDVKRMKNRNERLISILSKNTGQPVQKIRELFEKDTFFSAKEALEFGIIDRIIKPNSNINVESSFDDLDFEEEELPKPRKINKKNVKKK